MNLINCNSCGTEISPKAAACPKCGHPNEKSKNFASGVRILLYIALAIGIIWYFEGGGLDKQVVNDMQRIENKVAIDTVTQYQIAKRQGDPIQICVQASLVSAAYLQAKDESNYQKWKKTEGEDCRLAGIK